MRHTILAVTLTAALVLAGPVLAQSEEDVLDSIENIHGDVDGFNEAFALMQDAFLFGNPTAIADLGLYPLTVNANGEVYDIFEAQDLVDNFDSLLTGETIDALASQDYADLIVTSEGVGFANGALWMTSICLDDDCADTQWGILSINN
ncbi:hypothetical protein [Devosia beringensis]|uniref:hypothetical protein n=1 Tax=Devosia beringensis TaxID=2657486 RepID=UPI00186B629A|nr:hypothetical protein [Devosia beringensis]